jgi:glycogen debranching enzyme
MNPTSELQARPDTHMVASGRTLLVTDQLGQVEGGGYEGLWVDNTRVLSRVRVLVAGTPVVPFSSSVADDLLLTYASVPKAEGVPESTLYVELHERVAVGMTLELRFANHGVEPVRAPVVIELDADFAATDEVEEGKRHQQAPVRRAWDAERGRLDLDYEHADLPRGTRVRVESAPSVPRYRDGAIEVDLDVEPGAQAVVRLGVDPVQDGAVGLPTTGIGGEVPRVDALRRRLEREAPRLVSTNAVVSQAWRTAVADLVGLVLGLPSGPSTPAAGLPLFQSLFGRDTTTTAWQCAMALPLMAADVLAANAALQGVRISDWYDEEPGKLVQEARYGSMSALGIGPHIAYYGDYASPLDFLVLFGQHLAWSGDVRTTRQMAQAARRIVQWAERYGDLDRDGFLEYQMRSSKGVKHQGWKDAPNAIVDETGRTVSDPIATCELQGFWYAGMRQAAAALLLAGDRVYARRLLQRAERLRARFDETFWMPEEGFYALGLGPDKTQLRSITSNPGHLLATGIVPVHRAPQVVDRLLAEDMFSGWGIRTLSADHPAYSPFAYHLGTVWPVENATFALGFSRYGHWDAVHRTAKAFFDASDLFVANRLPEAIAGTARDDEHPHPGTYPRANEPQAWSASAVVLMVQTLLGIRPVAPARLLLVDPHLPEWLPDLRLEGVRVGQAVVDLAFWRDERGKTRFGSQVREGRLAVRRQPVPNERGRRVGPLGAAIRAGERRFE